MIGQQSLSVDSSGETPKLPRMQFLVKQHLDKQQLAKQQQHPASKVESRKIQLEKQRSMDGAVKDRPTYSRGYLAKQKSVETNMLLSRQQKMLQVNLVKQMSLQSVPGTPRGARRGLDKRLKKEQGMTILVSAPVI